jgi:hypothetical protein
MRMHCPPRSPRLVVHILLAWASASLLFSTTALAEPGQSRASTDNSLPSGLVVVIENKPQQDRLDLQALDNPFINGVALQIRWRDLEPVQGKPDWSKLDQLFAAAQSSKKWVQLLLFPGFFSPAWALEGAQTAVFPLQYGPGKGTLEKLPMPWDRVYLNHWFDFLKLVSDRYGKSPAFRVIAADGPTSVSAEFTLPGKPEDVETWLRAGYTPRRYLDAWQKAFQVFAADFPNQYVSLSLGTGLNINDRGKRDGRQRKITKQAVIDEGISALGRRFVFQSSNLDGNAVQTVGAPGGTALVISYNGRIITGFQLRTSCERNSGDMGAEGDPALALRRSIDKGMTPSSSGRHINYLEIYAPDVLADDMQPTLRYGASLFGR